MKKGLYGPKLRGLFDNYKPLIAAMAFLIISLSASAQYYDSNKVVQVQNAYGFSWKNGKFYNFWPPNDTATKYSVADSNALSIKNGVIYRWNGYYYVSTSAGGTTSLKNRGSGYRIAKAGTDSLNTLANTWGLVLDSATTGQIGMRADTGAGKLATKTDIATKWSWTGNSGTTPGTHFVGTTDPQDLVFKTNGAETGRLKPEGIVQFGKSTNNASGSLSTISGGEFNTASGEYSTISGGATNTASGNGSTISGGTANYATGDYSTITGGDENAASNSFSTVVGSDASQAYGSHSIVAGGEGNRASGDYSGVLSGLANISSAHYASILGGQSNKAKSYAGVVVGQFNDSTNATSETSYNALNRAFQIGIGDAENNRKNAMTVLFSGKTTLNQYGSGTFTGTPTKLLQVNSGGDIIEGALGTGVATALGVNTGTAGSFVVNGGALGTPSSGTVTNLTGTASININGTVGATTPTTGVFTTVGIGVASPVTKLDVETTGAAVKFKSTSYVANTLEIADPDGSTYITNGQFKVLTVPMVLNANASYITLQTAGVERMRVTNDGVIYSIPVTTDIDLSGGTYNAADAGLYHIRTGDVTNSFNMPDATTMTGKTIKVIVKAGESAPITAAAGNVYGKTAATLSTITAGTYIFTSNGVDWWEF